jgi:hypothetical protein
MKCINYAGYYLGCRCFNTWFPEGHEQYDNNWLLEGFRPQSPKSYLLGNQTDETWTDSIKPILRKLEDITDGEWLEIENETSIIPDAIGWHGIKESFMTMDIRHRWHWTITNEALIILRKRGIDVDQLIENGLALDSKTLK